MTTGWMMEVSRQLGCDVTARLEIDWKSLDWKKCIIIYGPQLPM